MKSNSIICSLLIGALMLFSCSSRESVNDKDTNELNYSRTQDDTGASNIMNNRDTADIRHATEQPGGMGSASNTDSANPSGKRRD